MIEKNHPPIKYGKTGVLIINLGTPDSTNWLDIRKYRWPLIDVTRKSVEETAASIIKIHEIYLNNAK